VRFSPLASRNILNDSKYLSSQAIPAGNDFRFFFFIDITGNVRDPFNPTVLDNSLGYYRISGLRNPPDTINFIEPFGLSDIDPDIHTTRSQFNGKSKFMVSYLSII